ncbi:hypothetical protein [Arthrobacter sp. StoSoilB13]|uniref:hypothetical protein n=1 Tax=Arthrobacter sp. StoSoilB13 TaxID=2830993 RepID=UPI001CC6B87A|nr:hypothetical protein [Arthrobacter sp. StoSoilB13]BCW49959.1 hypothetical protein StoSoilB13_23010 [Arthrobacter sp. StoSoilB13]
MSAPGTVAITCDGDSAGLSTFTPDPEGRVRCVTTIDAQAVANEISTRIVKAGRLLHDVETP